MTDQAASQRASAGGSSPSIHQAVVAHADPRPGLTWLDVGCGTGEVFDAIRPHAPATLRGADIIDWLAPGNDDVEMHVGPAEEVLVGIPPADRVLLVETMEHLESPWTVLRLAARLVLPGGRIVISTPNVATLRHRLELAVRGRLTSFRPDHPPHLSPILPHVTERILRESGLRVEAPFYAGPDIVPLTGGRTWSATAARRAPSLACVSVGVTATRPA